MTRTQWELAGKVVLITGGGRGIGANVAAELARRGAIPVLADVDEAALKETAVSIPTASTVVVDVTDYDACVAAVATVLERHGHLDIVWANAGIGAGGPVELVDADIWARVIEVNLLGAYNTVKASLDAVIAAQGYIAVTASLASFVHGPMMSAYAASKSGVEAFANALRIEVAHQGVDVGSLHPTWIATDMVTEADAESLAFQRLRASLRAPFAKTYPVDAIVGPIADAFTERRDRIFLPGFVRIAFVLRAVLNGRAATRDQHKVAPEIRRLFAEQAGKDGSRLTALGSRWHR